MVELLVKLAIALLMVSLSAYSGVPALDPMWKIAAVYGALAIFAWRLEERGLRNPGFAGLLAGGESVLIAFTIALSGRLDVLGFLVLAPMVEATSRFASDPSLLAPVAAGAVIAAGPILSGRIEFGFPVLAQAAGVLVIGLFSGRISEKNAKVMASGELPHSDRESLARNFNPLSLLRPGDVGEGDADLKDSVDDLLELRESYRQLRDNYLDLELRSKRDRLSATLIDLKPGSLEESYAKVVQKLTQISGAEGVVLYTMAGYDKSMVVRAVHGEFADPIHTETIEVDTRTAPIFIKLQAEKAYQAHSGEAKDSANVILTEGGRFFGMITLRHGSASKLDEARCAIEEVAPTIADWVVEIEQRETNARRLREAELMYDFATINSGEQSQLDMATRLVRELKDLLNADFVQICTIEQGEVTNLARVGSEIQVMDHLSFDSETGWAGWAAQEYPEVVMHDVRRDARFSSQVSVRAKIGSFMLIPVWGVDSPHAVLIAATKRAGSLDRSAAETLRIASCEFGRKLFPGLAKNTEVGPREFQARISEAKGSLIVLEVLRRESIESKYGRTGWIHVSRRWAKIVRTKLPLKGMMCRHEDGAYLVFLDGFSRDEAQHWVNQLVALAASTEMKTPDGLAKILSGLRGRVAELNSQENRFIDKMEA